MTTLDFRARVPVFDANIGVGHRHDRPSPFADAAGLRTAMHRHGIERGLIYHLQGEAISAIEGNEALLAWQDDALVPQWVAGPGVFGPSVPAVDQPHGGSLKVRLKIGLSAIIRPSST